MDNNQKNQLILRFASLASDELLEENQEKLLEIKDEKVKIAEGLGMGHDEIIVEASRLVVPNE